MAEKIHTAKNRRSHFMNILTFILLQFELRKTFDRFLQEIWRFSAI